MDFTGIAREISSRSNISVSPKDVERLFGALKKTKLPWELIDLSDFPVPSVFETMRVLHEKGLVLISDRGFKLTRKGKEVIVLGDDDLMSIVLGLSGLPKRITVVEIDERLTDFIESTAKKEGFQVDVERFDLRHPLPREHTRRYDTFFTDPPENLKAADAFIGRGISEIRTPGSAGYFGFTRREASLRKWHDVQRMLLKYKIVFTDIIHNFNESIHWGYEEETRAWRLSPIKVKPKKNWYRSALY